MVYRNNRNDDDVHLEKNPKPLKNQPKTSKTPKKNPNTFKTHQKQPQNLKIIQTSQNNRSRLFGKIIATMAMVGNVQK